MKIHYIKDGFYTRNDRYKFLLRNFKNNLNSSNSILDVGCDQNFLKELLGKKVFGVDFTGVPDKKIDLDKEGLSFFKNNSFNTVVCMDVLEHLENFHVVLDDIIRVSYDNVILSLPNCSNIRKVFKIVFSGNSGKFYGLPINKPADRHRWYFTFKEIEDFFRLFEKKQNISVELFYYYNFFKKFQKNVFIKFLFIFFKFKFLSDGVFIRIYKN